MCPCSCQGTGLEVTQGSLGLPHTPNPLPAAGPPWPVSLPRESGCGGSSQARTVPVNLGSVPRVAWWQQLVLMLTGLTPPPRGLPWRSFAAGSGVGFGLSHSCSRDQERPAQSWAVTRPVWPPLSHLQNGRGGSFPDFRLCLCAVTGMSLVCLILPLYAVSIFNYTLFKNAHNVTLLSGRCGSLTTVGLTVKSEWAENKTEKMSLRSSCKAVR